MLATIVLDEFMDNERRLMADAIEDICSANDSWGWASTGIYCFWEPKTQEILYIGIANNLCERFKQHTGLIKFNKNNCKVSEINNYFKNNPDSKLGITLLLQSKHEQSGPSLFSIQNSTGRRNIVLNEGLLLKTYQLVHKSLPKWNKIGGSIGGGRRATLAHAPILKFLNLNILSQNPYLVSLPIRELSVDDNAIVVHQELYIHMVRAFSLGLNINFKQSLNIFENTQRVGLSPLLDNC